VLDNCETCWSPVRRWLPRCLAPARGCASWLPAGRYSGVAGETSGAYHRSRCPCRSSQIPGLAGPPMCNGRPGSGPSDGAHLQAAQDAAVVALLEQAEGGCDSSSPGLGPAARTSCCGRTPPPRVARICWQLDGLPLAIELAAALVGLLPVEGIAARLDDRLGLLTSGPRTVLPRHQTLRAVMDWGHNLLTERERVLFRRLAIFAGGWTLGAAEQVCAGDEIEERDVLQLLGAW